jgi:hypothetical protein
MYRKRRRRSREIAFSLDSFLDVITNLIGIIIRMILVVWVGARSYHEIQSRLQLAPGTSPAAAAQSQGDLAKISDPLEQEIIKHRHELELVQQSLLEHLRQLPPLGAQRQAAEQELTLLAAELQTLAQSRDRLQQTAAQQEKLGEGVAVSLAEVKHRSEKLRQDITQFQQQPIAKKVIQYRTPVSRPVVTEELFFECQGGRVAFIDFAAMQREMNDEVDARKKDLIKSGSLEGFTHPAGAFRLHYLAKVVDSDPLGGTYRISGSGEVLPMPGPRGETLTEAFQPDSEFRQIVDHIDAKQTVVTFWVYPDSFSLFRQLRDYLYQRNIEVAARPLPFGHAIGFSPSGTASRSQ